jgi:outer membrane cobalamin receptor
MLVKQIDSINDENRTDYDEYLFKRMKTTNKKKKESEEKKSHHKNKLFRINTQVKHARS